MDGWLGCRIWEGFCLSLGRVKLGHLSLLLCSSVRTLLFPWFLQSHSAPCRSNSALLFFPGNPHSTHLDWFRFWPPVRLMQTRENCIHYLKENLLCLKINELELQGPLAFHRPMVHSGLKRQMETWRKKSRSVKKENKGKGLLGQQQHQEQKIISTLFYNLWSRSSNFMALPTIKSSLCCDK